MHKLRNRILFFSVTGAAGLSSLALHRYMMEHCMDDKGLLIRGNLPGTLLWVVGLAFVVILALLLRTIGGDGSYADNFPSNTLSAMLMVFAGGLMSCMLPILEQLVRAPLPAAAEMSARVRQATDALTWLLPRAVSFSMVILAVMRILGKRPWPIFSGIICLFYMLMLVSNYRLWSADPQLQDYAYQLLSGVLLMLCSFHRTCCDAGIIQRRKLLATGFGAAVCCMVSVSGDFIPGFYLFSGLWALGCLCDMAVLPPDPEEEDEPPADAEEPEPEA